MCFIKKYFDFIVSVYPPLKKKHILFGEIDTIWRKYKQFRVSAILFGKIEKTRYIGWKICNSIKVNFMIRLN